MNLTVLFASPFLAVVAGEAIVRFGIRRRPFNRFGNKIVAVLAAVAFFLPLAAGVWLPDLLGYKTILASAKSDDGHDFSVEQRWNYADFYTTALHTTNPDGSRSEVVLDGDANKLWNAELSLKQSERLLTISHQGRKWDQKW